MNKAPKAQVRWFVLILATSAIILIIFSLIKNSEFAPKTPTPSTSDAFTNWKTYSNDKNNYTFKYPPDWKIISVNGSIDFPPATPTPPASEADNILLSSTQSQQMQLLLNILDNPNNLSIKDYFIKEGWSKVYIENMQVTEINGFDAVKLDLGQSNTIQYFLAFGTKIADFQFSFFEEENKVSEPPEKIFHQILSTFNTIGDGGYLIRVLNHGGLCPEGECSSTRSIDNNGNVFLNGSKVGSIDSTELQNLINKINSTNYQQVKSKKFTGTCPTAYDGQEVIFYLSTDNGEEKIASCETDIDFSSSPFTDISNIFSDFINE